MTLIYSCVAQNQRIVAEAVPPSFEKNIDECARMSRECESVLEKLHSAPITSNFMAFTSINQSFFCLVDLPMTYIVVASSNLSRSQGQQFLEDLKSFFANKYEVLQQIPNVTQKIKPNIQQLMAEYQLQITAQPNKFSGIKTDINQAKDKLSECVELLLQRGDKLNSLYEEVDELKEMTVQFKRNSGELQKSFCRRSVKYFVWSGIALIVIIVAVVLIFEL
ncbi:SNARE [Hexamita inflata]|uniref:SNARE n=1 Tax=Hexamita inflata TaxID=28002 RepID=A0ABP1GUJ0_9EUKA